MIKANYCYVTHRGMHSIKQNIPENSLGAFKLAIQNKFAIHFEVQLSLENEPLVFGDDNFKRLCSLDLRPCDCPIDEAARLMLCGTEYRVLTLKQALKEIAGQVPILIEILYTEEHEIGILEQKVIDAINDYSGIVAIASKNPLSVLWFKNHYPSIHRGQIVNDTEANENSNFFKRTILKTQALNFFSSQNFICYNIDDLKESYADECHKKNIAILGYTATCEEQLKKSKQLCDGTIFEEIAVE